MLRGSLFALSLLTAFIAPAYANGLEATQTVERAIVTVDEAGIETITYEIAEEAAPGDELRYTISYTNESDKSAQNVKLDMPVPSDVTFIEGSVDADTAEITFSVDGNIYADRTELMVVEADTVRPATAEDITHVRWSFVDGIAPSAAGSISYSGVLK